MSNRLPVLAAEINRAHDQACRAAQTTLDHAIKVGERLIEAKTLLGHGKWLPWLTENCDFTDRTARNYMRLAKHRDEVTGKSATVSDLTVRAALDHLTEMSAAADNDHIFPPFGVVRIWPAGPISYLLIEQSAQHPGYFHSGFADLTEGGAFIITDKKPIKADFSRRRSSIGPTSAPTRSAIVRSSMSPREIYPNSSLNWSRISGHTPCRCSIWMVPHEHRGREDHQQRGRP